MANSSLQNAIDFHQLPGRSAITELADPAHGRKKADAAGKTADHLLRRCAGKPRNHTAIICGQYA